MVLRNLDTARSKAENASLPFFSPPVFTLDRDFEGPDPIPDSLSERALHRQFLQRLSVSPHKGRQLDYVDDIFVSLDEVSTNLDKLIASV